MFSAKIDKALKSCNSIGLLTKLTIKELKMAIDILTQDQLKSQLDYNPQTGVFTRKVHLSNFAKNKKTIGKYYKGYHYISVLNKQYLAHRLAWLYVTGEWPKNHIDHIDGNRANNKFDNLRDVTNAENHQNIYKANSNNKNGLLGASQSNKRYKKYQARIKHNYKTYCLGTYDTPEEAHLAYVKAKRQIHEFGHL